MSETIKELDELRQESLNTQLKDELPICLCIDTSFSMYQPGARKRTESVMRKLTQLREKTEESERLKNRGRVSVVAFNSTLPGGAQLLKSMEKLNTPLPHLEFCGGSTLADGMELALNVLQREREERDRNGLCTDRCKLFLLSDGGSMDMRERLVEVQKKAQELQDQNIVEIVCVDVSNGLDERKRKTLKGFLRKNAEISAPDELEALSVSGLFSAAASASGRTTGRLDANGRMLNSYE